MTSVHTVLLLLECVNKYLKEKKKRGSWQVGSGWGWWWSGKGRGRGLGVVMGEGGGGVQEDANIVVQCCSATKLYVKIK